ncbi:bifunctional folylpolyglutamate synthase/dihydrofolate synthase [Fusobacterium necrophorum]|uniref:tetrahydrofolate synthase n=1 Tax=Fusobacterium necrophorum subsp. funduliforme B35 TaxID=1226633 RepID=A0A017H350_9FUSO|nr:folylpolyglutamate synthase/dihydrofolate synthase family protein [Fusobacterium necrophorum]EYD68538.1 dihydrofolate synthase [Fusobacterium necrophorum subsp. funduliforme B35]KID50352.1 diaminohydroxyphosphoribosylaminopyrimidine deaminase [Fusobacterium necrophorum subsp. funduliforme B35]RXZ26433.1 bifunctional folylpolyglutamate synthase/dihydrofolate synthase [Fusobacterium necrophorum]
MMKIYSHSMFGIKLGLQNMERLCERLGHPERAYKIIHIAGTNGKGSTATTLEKILLEAGYRVGKYTSPHILKFNERIVANGVQISEEEIEYYYYQVEKIMKEEKIDATFFEITTAMMFSYFRDKGLDYVVLETGMGGRLDATNVSEATLCIITNVSLDHTEYLGDSIYKIAKEKAGIIKNCPKVIVADQQEEFLQAILEEKAELINVLNKYADAHYTLDFENFVTHIDIEGKQYRFSLFGDYQYHNFLCAYEAAKQLGISEDIIQKAAEKVRWECRFEVVSKEPLVILDGAHNPDGVRELVKIVKQHYQKREVAILTSILRDKDVKTMLEMMTEISDDILLTSLDDNPRGSTAEELFHIVNQPAIFSIEENMKRAYDKLIKKNRKLNIICGSFYTLIKWKEEVQTDEIN